MSGIKVVQKKHFLPEHSKLANGITSGTIAGLLCGTTAGAVHLKGVSWEDGRTLPHKQAEPSITDFNYADIMLSKAATYVFSPTLAAILAVSVVGAKEYMKIRTYFDYDSDRQEYRPSYGISHKKYIAYIDNVITINAHLKQVTAQTTCWVSPRVGISNDTLMTNAFSVLLAACGQLEEAALTRKDAINGYIVAEDTDGIKVVIATMTTLNTKRSDGKHLHVPEESTSVGSARSHSVCTEKSDSIKECGTGEYTAKECCAIGGNGIRQYTGFIIVGMVRTAFKGEVELKKGVANLAGQTWTEFTPKYDTAATTLCKAEVRQTILSVYPQAVVGGSAVTTNGNNTKQKPNDIHYRGVWQRSQARLTAQTTNLINKFGTVLSHRMGDCIVKLMDNVELETTMSILPSIQTTPNTAVAMAMLGVGRNSSIRVEIWPARTMFGSKSMGHVVVDGHLSKHEGTTKTVLSVEAQSDLTTEDMVIWGMGAAMSGHDANTTRTPATQMTASTYRAHGAMAENERDRQTFTISRYHTLLEKQLHAATAREITERTRYSNLTDRFITRSAWVVKAVSTRQNDKGVYSIKGTVRATHKIEKIELNHTIGLLIDTDVAAQVVETELLSKIQNKYEQIMDTATVSMTATAAPKWCGFSCGAVASRGAITARRHNAQIIHGLNATSALEEMQKHWKKQPTFKPYHSSIGNNSKIVTAVITAWVNGTCRATAPTAGPGQQSDFAIYVVQGKECYIVIHGKKRIMRSANT